MEDVLNIYVPIEFINYHRKYFLKIVTELKIRIKSGENHTKLTLKLI